MTKFYNTKFASSLPLHKYQKIAVNFVLTHPYAGLFLDVGLGKTLITLTALSLLKPENTLIIAPKNIARSTWESELEHWKCPLSSHSLIVNKKGNKLSKKKRYKEYNKVLITKKPALYFLNRDLVVDIVNFFLNMKKTGWPFPYVVIDESQSFKSFRSARTKALKKIRPQIKRLVELTGTPTPNGLMDLWPQIYLLDRGKALGRNITTYRNTFFRATRYIQNYPVQWTPIKTAGYDAEKDIYQRIKPMVISMKNTKLKLPKLTYVKDTVYLSDAQMRAYREMMKEKVLDVTPDMQVTAANAAVLSNKLSQMASGALYVDDNHDFIKLHNEKLFRTKYIIDNTDSPIIVAYHYKSDLKMLSDFLKKNKMPFKVFDGSPKMIKEWNAGKIKTILLQPASAGFGLNLQRGGHTLIWYTLPWSLEQYIQTNGRLYRQGQKYPVIIHQLVTAKTIDNHILRALKTKNMSQAALMNAVKATLPKTKKKKADKNV